MRPPSRDGFSLIELLVVISIIALLASLLAGGVGIVRTQAKRTACASSLRQIGIGAAAYGLDQDGTVPSAYISGYRWSDLVVEYTETQAASAGKVNTALGGRSVLNGCLLWSNDPTRSWLVGYGINSYADRPARPSANSRWLGVIDATKVHFHWAGISSPSGRSFLADCDDYQFLTTVDFPRHQGRANVLLFDLHVQSVATPAQVLVTLNYPHLGPP